jgi:hypothetical protein
LRKRKKRLSEQYFKERAEISALMFTSGIYNKDIREIRMKGMVHRYFADDKGDIYSLFCGILRKLVPVKSCSRVNNSRVNLYFQEKAMNKCYKDRIYPRSFAIDFLILYAFKEYKGPAYRIYHRDQNGMNNEKCNLVQKIKKDLTLDSRGILSDSQKQKYKAKLNSLNGVDDRIRFHDKVITQYINNSGNLIQREAREKFFEEIFKI